MKFDISHMPSSPPAFLSFGGGTWERGYVSRPVRLLLMFYILHCSQNLFLSLSSKCVNELNYGMQHLHICVCVCLQETEGREL